MGREIRYLVTHWKAKYQGIPLILQGYIPDISTYFKITIFFS
jgi:hypothetical protein